MDRPSEAPDFDTFLETSRYNDRELVASVNNPAKLTILLRAIIGDIRKLAEYQAYVHGLIDGHRVDNGRHRGGM